MTTTPDDATMTQALIDEAKQLFREHKLQLSEEKFTQVLVMGHRVADAHFGLGVVCLEEGRVSDSRAHFSAVLAERPEDANAFYYLGVVAQKQSDPSLATVMYERALSLNPSHQSARAELATLRARPTVSSQTAVPDATRREVADGPLQGGRYGVYEYLLQDASPLSRQTISLIDSLRTDRHPRFIAHSRIVSFLAFLLLLIGAIAVAMTEILTLTVCTHSDCSWTYGLPPEVWSELSLGIALWLVLILFNYLEVRTTHIVLDRGRLQVTRGILRRSLVNVELWRVHDIKLRQTFLNRLTGDGTVAFYIEQGSRRESDEFVLTGLASGRRLPEIYQQLLNLVFLLRSNPVVKGIIY